MLVSYNFFFFMLFMLCLFFFLVNMNKVMYVLMSFELILLMLFFCFVIFNKGDSVTSGMVFLTIIACEGTAGLALLMGLLRIKNKITSNKYKIFNF